MQILYENSVSPRLISLRTAFLFDPKLATRERSTDPELNILCDLHEGVPNSAVRLGMLLGMARDRRPSDDQGGTLFDAYVFAKATDRSARWDAVSRAANVRGRVPTTLGRIGLSDAGSLLAAGYESAAFGSAILSDLPSYVPYFEPSSLESALERLGCDLLLLSPDSVGRGARM
jgi:hypothetical protein